MTEFEKALKLLQQKYTSKFKKKRLSNLNPIQTNVLQQLRQNHNIIIKPTDKNLGPEVMDASEYIKQALQEHLLTNTYKQLSETEAKNKMLHLKNILKALISTHTHKIFLNWN
jgi:hypothetical protein